MEDAECAECAICLELLWDNVYITNCNHHFHLACITSWYEKNEKIECPYCRYMDICAICRQELRDDIFTTACNHQFHLSCITSWHKKVKRIECPYCLYVEDFDRELLTSIERLFVKLVSCRGVHDFSLKNLKQIDKLNDYFLYEYALSFIKSDDPNIEVTIGVCLESLISRGYMRKENDLYYPLW